MDYYVIGFLHSRGYVNEDSGEIRLQCEDRSILERVLSALDVKGSISSGILRVYSRTAALTVSSYRSVELSDIPSESLSDFIRGYFDGRSNVYIRKNKYPQITITGSLVFMYKLQDVLIRFGVESIVKPTRTAFQLIISKKGSVDSFKSFIYSDSVCGMERKRVKLFSV